MVGLMELWLAAIAAFSNGGDPLSRALAARGLTAVWAVIMVVLGLLVFIGSVLPLRALRQGALGATLLVMLSVMLLVIKVKLLTITTGVLLLMVTACLVLLAVDTVKGPMERDRC